MKFNIYKYLGILAVAGSGAMISSCEDYLDVSPESSFGVEEIFGSETETKAMLNTIYTYLTPNSLYGNNFPYAFNTNTDVEMSTIASSVVEIDDVQCFEPAATWGTLESTWNQAYKTINYCNDFLENIENSSLFSHNISEEGPTEMQQMYGEVHCIRAMIYFDLMRTWGDVVYRTKSIETTDELFKVPVTDRYEIYDDLIKDLQEVEKYMKPVASMQEGVERASREYCQALIGQLALYRGCWTLRPGGEKGIMERPDDYLEYYKIAKEYLGKVINEGRHTLSAESFEQMWRGECNYTALKNGDIIFEIPMLAEASSNYGYRIGVSISYDQDKPGHSYGGSSNSVSYTGTYPFTFDRRDIRRFITCYPYSYDNNLSMTLIASNKSRALCGAFTPGKWSKLYMEKPMKSSAGNTGINAIRMRYADVLLMYAEVVNELDGPTALAKDALKQVRRRAFEPADQAEMVDNYVDKLTSREDFFNAIYNERAWEFGGEGIRKYDLARWNLYGKTIYNQFLKFVEWGNVGNGRQPNDGSVITRIYWFEHKNASDYVTAIDILGLDGPLEGDDVPKASEGWKSIDYSSYFYPLNSTSGLPEMPDALVYSFRGYLTGENYQTIDPEVEVLRYLMPYPLSVIETHQGAIKQNYGYK